MYAYTYAYTYVCIYIITHAHIEYSPKQSWAPPSKYGKHLYIHTYIHIHMYVYTSLHTHTLNTHQSKVEPLLQNMASICIYIHIYIYICMHIHHYTRTHWILTKAKLSSSSEIWQASVYFPFSDCLICLYNCPVPPHKILRNVGKRNLFVIACACPRCVCVCVCVCVGVCVGVCVYTYIYICAYIYVCKYMYIYLYIPIQNIYTCRYAIIHKYMCI